MPPLLAQPRHAKPCHRRAARAALVPVVLVGAVGGSLSGLAISASAGPGPVSLTAAPTSSADADVAAVLSQRAVRAEQRVSRERAAAAAQAARVAAEQAAQAAAAEAARVAAEQAAAAEQARLAAERAAVEAAAQAAAEQARAASQYARPGVGRLTSGFGSRWGRLHRGVDLAAGTGSPVRAAAAGTVVAAGPEDGYGRAVRIRHADGSETLYAHNSVLLVSRGAQVSAGQQIAQEGNTGNSTGPHLHFEVRIHGQSVDPLDWLQDRGVAV